MGRTRKSGCGPWCQSGHAAWSVAEWWADPGAPVLLRDAGRCFSPCLTHMPSFSPCLSLPSREQSLEPLFKKIIRATFFFLISVYLRTTPETCYQRLKMRCREEEKVIPLVRAPFNLIREELEAAILPAWLHPL